MMSGGNLIATGVFIILTNLPRLVTCQGLSILLRFKTKIAEPGMATYIFKTSG